MHTCIHSHTNSRELVGGRKRAKERDRERERESLCVRARARERERERDLDNKNIRVENSEAFKVYQREALVVGRSAQFLHFHCLDLCVRVS